MASNNSFVQKVIDAPRNQYVIFYKSTCPYSLKALELLKEKKLSYKGYLVEHHVYGMRGVLEAFRSSPTLGFNSSHTTVPIIFLNQKFIGGYSELKQLLQ
jgi:glutaredoxin